MKKLINYLRTLPHAHAWALAWPMVISNISVPLMGLADTAMLGHLESPLFLAAVAIGSNIIALLYWMFAFLRMGTTSVTAQAQGANKPNLVVQHLSQNIGLALGLGAILIIIQSIALPFALWLIAPDPELLQTALAYCQIRIYSAPAVLINYVAMGWLIGLKKPKIPLLVTVFANVLNIVLDYIFIVHWDLQAKGAAYATLIAEYCACLASGLYIFYFLRGRNWRPERWFSLTYLKQNVQLTIDLFIRTSALLFVINFFNAQSALLGTHVLAANAVLFQFTLFVSFFLDGYALAGEAMTAQAIGARHLDNFHRASAVTTISACALAIVISAFFFLFGDVIISLLSNIDVVVNIAKAHLFWVVLIPLVSIWCYAFDGIFVGAGKAQAMRNTMLISVVCCFLPLWWLTRSWGNHGLWIAFIVFNGCRGITLALCYFHYTKQAKWLNSSN